MAAQIEQVKQQATNRWSEIISSLGGVDQSHFTGHHGPCPKCGGKDRWRYTSNEVGSAICNQCGKFGDGIAVVEWLTNKNTFHAVESIAKVIGVPSEKPKRSPSRAKSTAKKKKK